MCLTNICLMVPYVNELCAIIRGKISDNACVVSAFLICFFSYTSIGYFVELAIERCISISYLNTGHVDCISSILWLLVPPMIGFTLSVAPLCGWGKYGRTHIDSLYCGFDFTAIRHGFSEKSYIIVVCVVMVILPVIITSLSFFRIIKHHRRNFQVNAEYHRQSAYDATKSFFAASLLYFVSWTPYAAFCFMSYYEISVSVEFEYAAAYFAKSATITSPVVYCFMERQFIEYLKSHRQRPIMLDEE